MKSPGRLFLLGVLATLSLTPGAFAGPIVDSPGDTFGFFAPQIDIVNSPGVQNLGGGNYSLTVNFDGPISAASLFAPDSVLGYVDFDLDVNSATGTAPFTSLVTGGPLDMGMDAYINLFDEQFNPGFVGLYDSNNNLISNLAITYGPQSFTIDLPLASLGIHPWFSYAMVVGTPLEPTDRAPDGVQAFFFPEPGSVVLFGLLAAGGVGVLRRRRMTV